MDTADVYVYAWFDADGLFYIGRGTGSRAIDQHAPLRCEAIRRAARDAWRVDIIASGLSFDAAVELEVALVRLLRPRGNRHMND